jgi:antitoxin component YwqK of YwqJK toxin-antitoxin module
MKEVVQHYPNKNIMAHGFLKENKKEGLWVYYYENGNKFREIHYENGIENGKWLMWYENKNLYIEDYKQNGKSNGKWNEYYENGVLKEVGMYTNDHYTPLDFWDENGVQLLKNGSGKKIEKFGAGLVDIFEHHFKNGTFLYEIKL